MLEGFPAPVPRADKDPRMMENGGGELNRIITPKPITILVTPATPITAVRRLNLLAREGSQPHSSFCRPP